MNTLGKEEGRIADIACRNAVPWCASAMRTKTKTAMGFGLVLKATDGVPEEVLNLSAVEPSRNHRQYASSREMCAERTRFFR